METEAGRPAEVPHNRSMLEVSSRNSEFGSVQIVNRDYCRRHRCSAISMRQGETILPRVRDKPTILEFERSEAQHLQMGV